LAFFNAKVRLGTPYTYIPLDSSKLSSLLLLLGAKIGPSKFSWLAYLR